VPERKRCHRLRGEPQSRRRLGRSQGVTSRMRTFGDDTRAAMAVRRVSEPDWKLLRARLVLPAADLVRLAGDELRSALVPTAAQDWSAGRQGARHRRRERPWWEAHQLITAAQPMSCFPERCDELPLRHAEQDPDLLAGSMPPPTAAHAAPDPQVDTRKGRCRLIS